MNISFEVNYLSIFIAALLPMVIGFLWYTIFNKQWMKANGYTKEFVEASSSPLNFLIAFVSYLVLAFFLSNFFSFNNTNGSLIILILVLTFSILPDLRAGLLGLRNIQSITIDLLHNAINFAVISVVTYLWR